MAKVAGGKTISRKRPYLIVIQTPGTIDPEMFRRIQLQLGAESFHLISREAIAVLAVATSDSAADVLAKIRKESAGQLSVLVIEMGRDHEVHGFAAEALSRLLWASRDPDEWPRR